ncbi:MAG TPA: hypothetical protein PKC14_00190 [Candidatus Absconditabacterales bacterium]|nr:hypothetical protein [Candidatus Absconditabacterales bacterium]
MTNSVKLFVKNLEWHVSDESLKDFFAQYGEVISVNIPRPGGRSKGFGFVEFASAEAANKAFSEANGVELEGRALSIQEYEEREPQERQIDPKKLFIKNLDRNTTEEELSDFFGQYGKVVSASIPQFENKSKGFGFVEFESESDTQNALEKSKSQEIKGRKIFVYPYSQK